MSAVTSLVYPKRLCSRRIPLAGFVFAAISMLTLSCVSPRELTRAQAADLIRDSKDFGIPVSIPLPSKREWPTEAKLADEREEEAKRRAVEQYAKTNVGMATFLYLGLIEFSATLIEGPSRDHGWWRFELEPALTAKGKKEAIQSPENKSQKGIIIARRELIEVTGITTPKSGVARVDFTWKQIPTPAGEAFDPDSENYKNLPEWLRQLISEPPGSFGRNSERKYGGNRKGKAFLQLYDDGWRAQSVQF